MIFINLSAFYLLVSLGLIVLFYLLKGKRRDYLVPSTLLWKDMLVEYSTQRPRFKLQPDLLMFLQLLIVMLLIFAYAQPQLISVSDHEHFVIIVDASASMQAIDEKPNRFSVAISKALDFVRHAAPNSQFSIIKAAANPVIELGFTSNSDEVIGKLNKMSYTDTPLDAKRTLELANSLVEEIYHKTVVFFTDGAFPYPDSDIGVNTEYVLVGQNNFNVGITSLEVRSISGRSGEYQALIRINNASETDANFRLTISHEQRIVISEQVSISAGVEQTYIYPINSSDRAVFLVTLHVDDLLALDNTAYFIVGHNDDLRVLLISPGNYFLERALLTIPHVRVFKTMVVASEELGLYDLIIFDRVDPPMGFLSDAVFIGTVPPELNAYKTEVFGAQIITGWKTDHPLLRFVDFSELRVQDLIGLELPPEFTELVSATKHPLVFTYEQPDFHWILFTFDLHESNLPLQVGFPVFVANSTAWFFPQLFDPNHCLIAAGEQYHSRIMQSKTVLEVLDENNNSIPFYHYDSQLIISNLDKSGVYTLVYENGTTDYFAVNLLAAGETELWPQIAESVISDTPIEEQEYHIDLFSYCILAAVILLLIEYYVYHRSIKSLIKGGESR